MKIEIPDLTGAECGDIAITAAEGGIGYWSVLNSYKPLRWTSGPCGRCQHPAASHVRDEDCAECSCAWLDATNENVADNFVFYTVEHKIIGETPEWMADPGTHGSVLRATHTTTEITPVLIRRGFEVAIDKARSDLVRRVLGLPREDWPGEIDSDGADAIIQCGVFGEIVFG